MLQNIQAQPTRRFNGPSDEFTTAPVSNPFDGFALGEQPFDREMTSHLDENKGFGRFDRLHIDDDAEQKRQAQRTMLIGGVLIGSIFWAAIMLFIAFDPQQRIHAALEAQLYGEQV